MINIVNALVTWESSNKRCCVWEYISANVSRKYCAAAFGLNLSADSNGKKPYIDFGFLTFQLQQLMKPRLHDTKLINIKYGDDEWLLYLLLTHYFYDVRYGVMGIIDPSQVYHTTAKDVSGMSLTKRCESNCEATQARFERVSTFIQSIREPHRVFNYDIIRTLYCNYNIKR